MTGYGGQHFTAASYTHVYSLNCSSPERLSSPLLHCSTFFGPLDAATALGALYVATYIALVIAIQHKRVMRVLNRPNCM
jgi:hypothetical protein